MELLKRMQNKKYIVLSILIITSMITLYYVFEDGLPELVSTFIGNKTRYSYFTIQSNFIAAIWFILAAFGYVTDRNKSLMQNELIGLAVTVYLIIAGLIYWIVLKPIMGGSDEFSQLWVHGFTPIIACIVYIVIIPGKKSTEKRIMLKKREIIILLIYPIVYFIYAFFLVGDRDGYIYPILDPDFLGDQFHIAIIFCAVIAFFLTVAAFLRKIKRISSQYMS